MTAHLAECGTNGMFPGVLKGQGTPGEHRRTTGGTRQNLLGCCTIKESSNVSSNKMALPLT